MWGIIPAAGAGTRIQPLAFSKELLPVGSRVDETGTERPRAVSEYLVERMVRGGATKICFVIAPGKGDILAYYGGAEKEGPVGGAETAFVVQPRPAGLCDALFRAAALVHPGEDVLIGLPDTVWFPLDGFRAVADAGSRELAFLLFPVERPEFFDAVVTGADGRVEEVQVKQPGARSHWVWGAMRMPGRVFHDLARLWRERLERDEFLGTLVNAYLAVGGTARGVRAGEAYVDVGTLGGYREALRLLERRKADWSRRQVAPRQRGRRNEENTSPPDAPVTR